MSTVHVNKQTYNHEALRNRQVFFQLGLALLEVARGDLTETGKADTPPKDKYLCPSNQGAQVSKEISPVYITDTYGI